MAKVCNPIYDTVFKYLVEDKRVAKAIGFFTIQNILIKYNQIKFILMTN